MKITTEGWYTSAAQWNHVWGEWQTEMWLMSGPCEGAYFFRAGDVVDAIVHV